MDFSLRQVRRNQFFSKSALSLNTFCNSKEKVDFEHKILLNTHSDAFSLLEYSSFPNYAKATNESFNGE